MRLLDDRSGVRRAIARVVTTAGAIGSLALLLRATPSDAPIVLRILFVGWVLSPFAGLAVADLLSKRWPASIGAAPYIAAFLIAPLSLALYANVAGLTTGARPTALLLMVPLGSWCLLGTALAVSAIAHRTASTDRRT